MTPRFSIPWWLVLVCALFGCDSAEKVALVKHDPSKEWEATDGGLDRLKVPGGWIYQRTFHDVHGSVLYGITFVPAGPTQTAYEEKP